ncbi:hypothetical protein LB507_007857 [Fusarium sp. FIESC RH6]|nr:hypothetical protein LB507_007857 [Fusarium sp. FIESC RH6]
MDPSVSVKKEKNKGKSKKNKKEKKDKKEKTKKEKQTVSIDLTSPARAHTPPPGPDAVSNAAHTPTRALSRQNSKRRGRSITQREEAKPASVSDDNKRHTYNSRPLPLFSSNDSTDTPSTSTGTNAVRPRAKSAAAVPDRPRTNDTERSTYSHDCKIKALETCLSLRDRYLDMPPAVQTDQEPFWTQVRDSLERKPSTRGKFKDWQAVQRSIESWCQPRRSSMREERLPAVSQSHPELDELVDQWNLVFAQRFCKINMGYFSNAIWPQFVQEKVTEIVESSLNAKIADILTKRYEALQGPDPSALLPSNSSLKDYGNALKAMDSQSTAAQTDEDQIRKSEAVMSMVLELQPGIRAALSQFLSGGHTLTSREQFNPTIPPNRAAPPALQRPLPSLGPVSQLPPPSLTLPARPPPSATSNDPTFSRGSRSTESLEKSGEQFSRKRKGLDLPPRSSPADARAKRPRYESHFSDLPPVTNFALSGRDNHGHRTLSSQRPRPRSPQRPKTSYGPIETQGHQSRGNGSMPPMTPCPAGPGPTTEPRTDVPRCPADRKAPGDYYRPDYMSR